MNSSHRKRRNLRLLLTARGVRAFGEGFVSILVPVYLTGIGFGAFEVGALTTAMLLGPAMMTLGIGLIAHRLKTVRLLASATTLMVVSGIGYAFETEFWPLLTIALVGTLSPTASYVSRLCLPRCYCVYDLSSVEIAGRGTCKRAGERAARPVAAGRIYLGRAVQSRLVWRRLFRPVTARAVAV